MKLLSYGDDSALKVDETGFYVSFADMMTLLMVFFVMMFSISKPDASKFDEVASSMVQAFNQEVAQDIIDEVNLLEELERNLDTTIKEMSLSGEISEEMMDQISTEITPDGLKLELASSALFSAGSAQILPVMKETLKRLNAAILRLPTGQFIMRIEGRTDDVPISTAEFRSNWELASDRAINVLNLFESDGFPSNQMAAVSFADTQPKVPNRTAKGEPIRINQAKNRRVVVFIKPVTP